MSPLPLHPVYEELPTVEGFHWSLVIGLGPLAESLIDYLPERLTLSEDAGLYRSGQPGPPPQISRIDERIAKTAIALVIVDAADPLAREQAGYWSQRFAAAGVYLHTTLILNATVNRGEDQWLQALRAPYIEVYQDETLLDQISVALAMLPGFAFMQGVSLIRYCATDLESILRTGTHAQTTAISWTYPEPPETQITYAISLLAKPSCTGALLLFNCSVNYDLAEHFEIYDLLGRLVPDDVSYSSLLMPSRDLVEKERVLSITLVYA
jgi:hypothetical protein